MHWTVEPHILTQEKPSGLKAKLTCGRNGYGLDGLWACPWSIHVPLDVIQVFIRLFSVPFLFDCVISRLDASPSNYVARTVCAESAPGHLLKESLQVDLVQGSPASHALSISDKQGCDCYSVGAVARDLVALAGADELGRVELAGDEIAWRESLAKRHVTDSW